jgi:hypothetical protein
MCFDAAVVHSEGAVFFSSCPDSFRSFL